MPTATTIIDADVVRTLGDPLRWRIVELLADEELCVCHLVEELGVTQSLVSHHLRVLRGAGIVECERFRYWTYYRLVAGALESPARRLAKLAAKKRRPGRRPCC